VRELIACTRPGYEAIGEIDARGREFEVEGRVFSEPSFATANGRAQLAITPLPRLSLPDAEHFGGLPGGEIGAVLNGIAARSYGHHNSVVTMQADRYRGLPHRQTMRMNSQDLVSSGPQSHQRVSVQGEAGLPAGIEIIPGSIRPGAWLMLYSWIDAIPWR
jgi:hypothetical protein